MGSARLTEKRISSKTHEPQLKAPVQVSYFELQETKKQLSVDFYKSQDEYFPMAKFLADYVVNRAGAISIYHEFTI